jgi:hypothetical protein
MPTAHDLIGTWRVAAFREWPDGREQHPFGENPVGYAIFDPAGRIFIHLSMSPGRGVTAE